MDKIIDLSVDPLSAAPFTPEQRVIWETIREEIKLSRVKIQDLEAQVKSLNQMLSDEEDERAILTRPEFNREVARMLAFDERYGGLSSILYLDFENFEEVAKNYGNAISNAAIRTICNTLSKNTRTSDIVGRLATNEFGVLLVRCDNSFAWKKGETLAAKLKESILEVDGHKINPVISYGAYTFSENADVSGGIKHAAEAITHN